MATIMQSGKRRCDAACHQAKDEKCNCICEGRFHGAKGATDRQVALLAKHAEQLQAIAEAHCQPAFDFTGENNEQS